MVIPDDHVVILDVSPPKLHTIVLFGTLRFDHLTPDVHLQARHIFIYDGRLEVRGPVSQAAALFERLP